MSFILKKFLNNVKHPNIIVFVFLNLVFITTKHADFSSKIKAMKINSMIVEIDGIDKEILRF
jgi:hypothetical protein